MAATNILATEVTFGTIVAYVINWLKQSKYFPWITEETQTLGRILAAVGAGLAAVGITAVWNADAHSLTITGITLVGMLTALWAFVKQFAIQHLASKVMYPAAPKEPVVVTPAPVVAPAPKSGP